MYIHTPDTLFASSTQGRHLVHQFFTPDRLKNLASVSWAGLPIKAQVKPPKHHGTMELRGIRGIFN